MGSVKSSQCRSSPVCGNSGRTSQKRSTTRTARMARATIPTVRARRFTPRESSTRKGTAKWKTTRNRPTSRQPPWNRRRYQGISSGRFPDQMIRNCENEK
jgi:hypothetical protein